MSAHRTLNDIFRAYDTNGPGRLNDPGDAGTITVSMWGQVCSVTTEGASETRTLAQPTKPGILCAVAHDTDGGDFDLTVAGGYNRDGDMGINFADAKDYVVFMSIKAGTSCYWRAIAQEGTDAAIEDLTADTATISTAAITNATVGKLSVTMTSVNAAGSAIGNAAALSYGVNKVLDTDNTKGVILPVATANAVVEVLQTINGKQLAVYPQVNSTISGLTANVAFNTGAANTAAQAGTTQNVYYKFIAAATNTWYVSK